ncbi:alcohol dehydrogenase [Sphingomonas panacis]|uniref:Alcohol dehydrogenase n=2 Tax=Sphingomonas panacis TaxID=1560345 RepID=A0A1B3ZHQ2_9SPHN|nr:alcohol dehydrogenase [Sphingomonas panacis]
MKAIRYYEYGGPEVLRYDQDVSEPALARDALLIEAEATSVNPHDWKARSGALRAHFPIEFPHIPGFDVSGIVRAVGKDVQSFRIGDRVLAMAKATYAELVVTAAATVARLPEGLDPADAAALPTVVLTGDQLINSELKVTAGQTVLVTGALGSVGRAAIHAANTAGARVIAGVRGRQLGEAAALQVAGSVAIDDADEIATLGKIDAVADMIGRDLAPSLLALVRPGGHYGYASRIPDGTAERFPDVSVSRVFGTPNADTLYRFAEDFRDGRFSLPISARMPLHDAGEAHARLAAGGGGKIVLTMR